MTATRSIHHRRRWFYVLWGVLLMASLTALGLWETPKLVGAARLSVRLKVDNLPPHSQMKVWAGPHGRWPGATWAGQGAAAEVHPSDEKVVLEGLLLPVSYRRWGKDTIPRRTADLVVLRFQVPGQAPRFLPLPLGQDWRSGLLRPERKMSVAIQCEWQGLTTDPAGFGGLD